MGSVSGQKDRTTWPGLMEFTIRFENKLAFEYVERLVLARMPM
jgi:hypothetical protein